MTISQPWILIDAWSFGLGLATHLIDGKISFLGLDMIHLYHLNKSRSFRIVWLLEELKEAYGLDYQLHTIERDAATYLAPDYLKQIHPMGKAPILVDDSLPAGEQALAESAAIMAYLLKAYDPDAKFHPVVDADSVQAAGKAWRDYEFWMHFAEGSLMPPMVMSLILQKASAKSPWFARPVINQLKDGIHRMILDNNISSALKLLETALAGQSWLAKDFSAADIQMHLAVYGAKMRGTLPKSHQHTIQWLERCQSRPVFARALGLAGSPL